MLRASVTLRADSIVESETECDGSDSAEESEDELEQLMANTDTAAAGTAVGPTGDSESSRLPLIPVWARVYGRTHS
jgi:hypothetical protein